MKNSPMVVSVTESDVRDELRFHHLNERGFVRGASAIDQWFILVNDAWKQANIPMDAHVRDYLVTMLNRFTTRTELFAELKAFEYSAYLLGKQAIDEPCVQDVADMSLQYVAYFPEQSGHRHEPRTLRYSAEIGISLYERLARQSAGKDDWYSVAYGAMARSFGRAVMVLRSSCARFLSRERVRRAVERDGHMMLTDGEATRIARQASTFSAMYCVTPFSTSDVH